MSDADRARGWKERLLRVLLRVYPADFRTRFADELVQAHRDLWRQAGSEGRSRSSLVLRLLADTLSSALRLRLVNGPFHSSPLHRRVGPGRGIPMEQAWQDVRYAFRALFRNPAFSLVALTTLALGIGANTAIFSVVDAVLLRPLPFVDSDRLVWLSNRYYPDGTTGAVSAPEFWEYRQANRALDAATVVRPTAANLTGLDTPLRIQGAAVSPAYFDVLGLAPMLGRSFAPDEERPDSEPVVMISEGLWQRAFGQTADILGRSVRMDGVSRTIVGIMESEAPALVPLLFSGTPVDFWIPATLEPARFNASNVEVHNLNVVARLAQGATLEGAEEALRPAVSRVEARYPGISNEGQRDVRLQRLRDRVVGDIGTTLWILLGTVGLVLLVACVNVTNLLLARGEQRASEMSVRIALGAGRARVLVHSLLEGALIGVSGGFLGVLLAVSGQRWLVSIAPPGLPRLDEVGLSPMVLGFAFTLSFAAGLLAAALPARRALRSDLPATLSLSGRDRGLRGRASARFRRSLVVGEVAAAVVVVAAAGLLGRSLVALRAVDPGFETSDLYMVGINAANATYPDLAAVRRLYASLLDATESVPAISGVSASWQTPFQGGMSDWPVKSDRPDEDWIGADPNWVSASYFETHGMQLLEGRLFESSDLDRPEGTVIVGESAARRIWPGESAVGKLVNIDFDEPVWREVVGVVSDVRARGLGEAPRPQTYFPFSDVPFGPIPSLTLTVRTSLGAESLRAELEDILARIDPEIPLGPVQSMSEQLAVSLARERFLSVLVGVFGGIALFLGTIGVYGLLSHTVSRQRREIGLRIALGARPNAVLRSVIAQATALASAGVLLGLLVSMAATRLLDGFLYGVTSTDLPTLGVVCLIVMGAAGLASYFPARWAASVDPITALREE